jgi:hypothetical protein
MEKLHRVGMYVPGQAGNEDKALNFWGRVLEWGHWEGREYVVERAKTGGQQAARMAAVESILTHLRISNGLVYFENTYYNNNRSLCYRFFSAVQMLLAEKKIRYQVVRLDTNLKAFTWDDPE